MPRYDTFDQFNSASRVIARKLMRDLDLKNVNVVNVVDAILPYQSHDYVMTDLKGYGEVWLVKELGELLQIKCDFLLENETRLRRRRFYVLNEYFNSIIIITRREAVVDGHLKDNAYVQLSKREDALVIGKQRFVLASTLINCRTEKGTYSLGLELNQPHEYMLTPMMTVR